MEYVRDLLQVARRFQPWTWGTKVVLAFGVLLALICGAGGGIDVRSALIGLAVLALFGVPALALSVRRFGHVVRVVQAVALFLTLFLVLGTIHGARAVMAAQQQIALERQAAEARRQDAVAKRASGQPGGAAEGVEVEKPRSR